LCYAAITVMRAPHVAMRMAAILAVIAGGCDGSDPEDPRPVGPPVVRPSAPAYRTVADGAVGSVSGTVRWRGEVPPGVEIAGLGAGACARARSLPSLRLGANGGVPGAVIVLEEVHEGRLGSGGALDYAFSGCELQPEVAAVSAGTTLRFRNDEDVLHNLRVVGARRSVLDVGLPNRGASAETVAEQGVYRITDDAAHPWIESFLFVAPHPYVVVTNEEGRFNLSRVPVGSYHIRLWHPGIRNRGPTSSGRPGRSAPIVLLRPLAVSEGNDSPTDFELDATAVEAAGSATTNHRE
jgi:hypothetical protein